MKKILVLVCMVLFLGTFVSAEYATAADRFLKNNDGTVTDTQTGLMWADQDNGYNVNWYTAKSYSERKSGWRMPTFAELAVLRSSGAYGTFIKKTGSWVWSSETDGSSGVLAKSTSLRFTDGTKQVHSSYDADGDRAIPVRSAK